MAKPRTLYDKIWDDHLVDEQPDGTCLIYIDRHLVHEVTSPQAFEGLRLSGRKVRAPEKTLAVVDHNVPTTDRNAAQSGPGKRGADRAWPRMHATSASNISTSTTGGRASCTSSVRSRASPARHDDRLRRQPYVDARRVRRARLWHRHIRGRTRAGDADADPEEGEEHARGGRRQTAARRRREGRHSRDHRRDRHGRRHRPRHRIHRRSDPRAVDGRADDGLQHVDRGRRPRRHGRAG